MFVPLETTKLVFAMFLQHQDQTSPKRPLFTRLFLRMRRKHRLLRCFSDKGLTMHRSKYQCFLHFYYFQLLKQTNRKTMFSSKFFGSFQLALLSEIARYCQTVGAESPSSFFCHNHCHKFPKQKSGGKVLQDVEILVSYERTMHLCMLPAKKSPFRCLADLLRLCLQKKSTPKMAPDLVQGGFFSHLSSQDARKEYLWKESGEEARWKQSLWDSIHVTDSSGEIANERACGFLNAGCEAKCECSARMLGEIFVAGCKV